MKELNEETNNIEATLFSEDIWDKIHDCLDKKLLAEKFIRLKDLYSQQVRLANELAAASKRIVDRISLLQREIKP